MSGAVKRPVNPGHKILIGENRYAFAAWSLEDSRLNPCSRSGDETSRQWFRLIPAGNRGAVNIRIAWAVSGQKAKIQEISSSLGVTFRTTDENQQVTKHVESIQVPCLDQGSKPCCSTYQHAIQWQHAAWACVKNSPFFREKPLLFYRCPLIFNHLPDTFPFCTRSVPVST